MHKGPGALRLTINDNLEEIGAGGKSAHIEAGAEQIIILLNEDFPDQPACCRVHMDGSDAVHVGRIGYPEAVSGSDRKKNEAGPLGSARTPSRSGKTRIQGSIQNSNVNIVHIR